MFTRAMSDDIASILSHIPCVRDVRITKFNGGEEPRAYVAIHLSRMDEGIAKVVCGLCEWFGEQHGEGFSYSIWGPEEASTEGSE